jgi:hypothetical protein
MIAALYRNAREEVPAAPLPPVFSDAAMPAIAVPRCF